MAEQHRIDWAPLALDDLGRILDHLADRESPEAAQRVGKKLLGRIEGLRQFPSRCRVVPELADVGVHTYRELIVRPYRVFFRIGAARVEVLGVLDGRRDLEELLLSRLL